MYWLEPTSESYSTGYYCTQSPIPRGWAWETTEFLKQSKSWYALETSTAIQFKQRPSDDWRPNSIKHHEHKQTQNHPHHRCSSNGIGSALAQALAHKNHHISATARNTSKIPNSLTSLSNVTILPLDITSPSSITKAVEAVEAVTEGLGSKGLNVLVNNAGFGFSIPVLDMDIERVK